MNTINTISKIRGYVIENRFFLNPDNLGNLENPAHILNILKILFRNTVCK